MEALTWQPNFECFITLKMFWHFELSWREAKSFKNLTANSSLDLIVFLFFSSFWRGEGRKTRWSEETFSLLCVQSVPSEISQGWECLRCKLLFIKMPAAIVRFPGACVYKYESNLRWPRFQRERCISVPAFDVFYLHCWITHNPV